MSRTSWTTSVLFIGCNRPATLGSLLSCPSSMKLFDRRRMPLTEKFVPAAKPVWPEPSCDTPGACSASEKMSRLLITGSSATRRVSNRTPTSALVVFSKGVSAVTCTDSATPAGRSVTSIAASWFSVRFSPDCL
jgi:hypothetical protein